MSPNLMRAIKCGKQVSEAEPGFLALSLPTWLCCAFYKRVLSQQAYTQGWPQAQPAQSYNTEDMNAGKPQKQPLMGLGVPHPIPGLSYPSLIVSPESQGEVEALTGEMGGVTTTQNDYNLSSDYLKPAKDPRYTACSFKAWEADFGPGEAE